MHTFTGWNCRDKRSGHARTSRRNYFSSHSEVRTQGVGICRMSAVLIITAMVTFSSEFSEIWEHVPKSLKFWEAFRNFRKISEEFSGWPSSEDDHGLAL